MRRNNKTSTRFRLRLQTPVLRVGSDGGNIEATNSISRLAARWDLSAVTRKDVQGPRKESAVRYYRHIRLLHARRLLLQSELPLIEVAVASGFGSLEHFSRTYKTEFGKSPQEDRRPGMAISTRRVLA